MSVLEKPLHIQNQSQPRNSWEGFQHVFVRSVALILLLTAFLKLLAVSSEGLSLNQSDPVFHFLSQRQLVLLAAVLEAIVAFCLLRRLCLGHAVELIAWLGSVFLLYRAGAYAAGWRGPCFCFGGGTTAGAVFTSWTTDWLAKVVLAWMLGGSLLILARRWKWPRIGAAASEGGALIALLVGSACGQMETQAAVSIEGKLHAQGFNKDGSVQYDKTFGFETWRGRLHWKVMVNYGEYSEIVGWDGEKTCYAQQNSEDKLRRDLGPNWAKYLASGFITDGVSTYPYHCEPTTRLIWLALASSAYFSETNMPQLSAIYSGGFNDPVAQLAEASKVELLDPVGGLPARVDFVINCRRATSVTNWPFLSYTISDKDLRRAAKNAQEYQGFTTGEYRVVRSTNAAGITIPVEFEFQMFLLVNKARIRWQRFHGTVEQISTQNQVSFLPEINAKMAMRDYRFIDRALCFNEVGYVVTNGIWPSAAEPWLKQLVEQKRTAHRMGLQRSLSPARRVFTALLIGAILLLPVLLLRWKRRPTASLLHHQKEKP